MNYAIIAAGTVKNVIVADSQAVADMIAAAFNCDTAVDVTGQPVGEGFTYDSKAKTFAAPV